MMQSLTALLRNGNHTLVVAGGDGEVRTFDRRGVVDLFDLLTAEPQFLRGAVVADKVVGKGAAALMISGGVAEVHTGIISEAALALFAESNVRVTFDRQVPFIRNRAGTGCCPVEALCRDCATAAECLPRIRNFILNS